MTEPEHGTIEQFHVPQWILPIPSDSGDAWADEPVYMLRLHWHGRTYIAPLGTPHPSDDPNLGIAWTPERQENP